MKKIIDVRQLVSFDNGRTFHETSGLRHIYYEEKKEDFIVKLNTFEKAYNFIQKECLTNAEIGTTILTNKKKIFISISDYLDTKISFTEKKFKPIIVKTVYKEEKNLTIHGLSYLLNANDFCEYLKDRKISSINF